MYKGHAVAVVMPIHNEERQVERAISRVPRFVDMIIAVDDGSTDRTWQRLKAIPNDKLVLLRHSQNRGVGAATKTGYSYSLQSEASLIAVMDGDGQMDGRDLEALLERAAGGVDYVKGNRFLHRDSLPEMPLTRRVGNGVFSALTKRAAAFAGNLDAQCGYTVIRRGALKRIDLGRLYDRYGFLNEMLFAACRAGLVVESVPVRSVYADEVSGINPVKVVPTILFLIARNLLRRKLELNAGAPMIAVNRIETKSGD
ncbi:MAG TPA: glycosyltransferase family 2 protein [Blastocatellia bacterium]|nr:glycosyltransferase family 2 protein [Blastocatellia bacterium]